MSSYSQQERNEEFIWYDGGNSPITYPAEFPDVNDVTKGTETDWMQRTPGSHFFIKLSKRFNGCCQGY